MSNASSDVRRLLSAPILPILTAADEDSAVGCARALAAAGVPAIEVTLRTPAAFAAIRAIVQNVPGLAVGVGTVLNVAQLDQVVQVGAHFAISPGCTLALLKAGRTLPIPYIPAITTASELMRGLDHGYDCFKFFPAESSGGAATLKALAGPFPEVSFCATGGISAANAASYLKLKSVLAVGASWLTPAELVGQRDWAAITELAVVAMQLRARI